MSNTPTAGQRSEVKSRAHGYCEYCRSPVKYGVQAFECEHIIPLSKGGETTLDNLAYACGGCNRIKATRTTAIDPDSGRTVPLFHPRQQEWDEHFAWNPDYTLIIGLTATGRATVMALHLNRSGVVNLRRALLTMGEHPPVDSTAIS
jgi:hypothetical protein